MLTDGERREWAERGYLVKPGLLSTAECDALVARISETIARVGAAEGASGWPNVRDPDYFRGTARRIGLFWEREMAPETLPPRERERCVARLGHGLHLEDDLFRQAACHPAVADVLEALVGPGVNVVQSMIIYKQARVGGEMGFHQDAAYLQTEPMTLLSAWMALDDVTEENSPLCVIPGSHRLPLQTISEMDENGRFEDRRLSDARPDPATALPVPVPRGGVIFFHGLLYHGSAPNRSDRPRRAYAVHYASAASRWLPTNWIDGSPGFMRVR
jgi:phytanoyl-CoA hydroxylase